jgi:hypothetical protein
LLIFLGDNRQKHLSFFDNLGTNSLSGRLRAIFKTVKKANSSSKLPEDFQAVNLSRFLLFRDKGERVPITVKQDTVTFES